MCLWFALKAAVPADANIHGTMAGKSTPRRITIIQGHPDPDESRFCHAIGWTYEQGAVEAGHQVRTIDVARLDFPMLRTRLEFEKGKLPADIRAAQDDIRWANHLVICYPLWLGTLPALLKGFFEQTFRYGFAFDLGGRGDAKKLLKGRSARIIVTMGMPAADPSKSRPQNIASNGSGIYTRWAAVPADKGPMDDGGTAALSRIRL